MSPNWNQSQVTELAPELPITKAGLIVYERPKKGHSKGPNKIDNHLRILAGLSDRYGEAVFFTMLKGSLNKGKTPDKDETPRKGAAREAGEESGFSLEKALGKKAFKRWLAGKEIKDIESNDYKGLHIVSANPHPVVDHTYVSRFGRRHHLVLYGIEVEGLGRVASHLKGANKSPWEWTDSEKCAIKDGLPDVETRLSIMRTGKVPARKHTKWANARREKTLFESPVLPGLETKYGIEVRTLDDMMRLCQTMSGTEFNNVLTPQLELFKKHLTKRKVISDSNHPFKLDLSDQPLRFYTESATVEAAGDVLKRSHDQRKYPLYEGSMWGGYAGKSGAPRSEDDKLQTAQIAGLLEFLGKVAPMVLAAASMDDKGVNRDEPMLNKHMLRAIDLNTSGWVGRMKQKAAEEAEAKAKSKARSR